jgi:hypothetical protein
MSNPVFNLVDTTMLIAPAHLNIPVVMRRIVNRRRSEMASTITALAKMIDLAATGAIMEMEIQAARGPRGNLTKASFLVVCAIDVLLRFYEDITAGI